MKNIFDNFIEMLVQISQHMTLLDIIILGVLLLVVLAIIWAGFEIAHNIKDWIHYWKYRRDK